MYKSDDLTSQAFLGSIEMGDYRRVVVVLKSVTQSDQTSNSSENRNADIGPRVNSASCNPNGELLARRNAASESSAATVIATGPKASWRHGFASCGPPMIPGVLCIDLRAKCHRGGSLCVCLQIDRRHDRCRMPIVGIRYSRRK